MPLVLYQDLGSPPSRLVLLTAKALNIQLEIKTVSVLAADHHKPEFVKINPQRTVPVLVDGDLILPESRAIAKYLVNKYGEGSSLYPTELRARALVDQRLDFDLGTLYAIFSEYFFPQVVDGTKPDPARFKKLEDALVCLDIFLEGHTYAVGDQLTLADLAFAASISTIEASNISVDKYSNIKRWYELVKTTIPGYKEINEHGANAYGAWASQVFEPKAES